MSYGNCNSKCTAVFEFNCNSFSYYFRGVDAHCGTGLVVYSGLNILHKTMHSSNTKRFSLQKIDIIFVCFRYGKVECFK